jgi:GT2 family glycosyltransferase
MTIKRAACYSFSLNNQDPLAHLRLIGPFGHAGINIINGIESGQIMVSRVSEADVVVIQRNFPKELESFRKIVQLAHKKHKPVIFDMDDLLVELPEYHPERRDPFYASSVLPIFEALLSCDLITVSTERLKEYVLHYNDNVVVLPNYFDAKVWKLNPPGRSPKDPSGRLTIGYMGGGSHKPDLDSLTFVFLELIKKYPTRIQFHFWGINPPPEIASYPQVKSTLETTYKYKEFAAFFQQQKVDIFVAPLVDNRFNRCKSPIKFFEYSSLGAPGVYSRLDPYRAVIVHEQNGLLASSPEEWVNCLDRLIQDDELRFNLAQNAQRTIQTDWLLSDHAKCWTETYEQLLEREPVNEKRSRTELRNFIETIDPQITEAFGILEKKNQALKSQIEDLTYAPETSIRDLDEIRKSKVWKLALLFRRVRLNLVPIGSQREKIIQAAFGGLKQFRHFFRRRFKNKGSLPLGVNLPSWDMSSTIPEVKLPIPPKPRECTLDIIVCVHNAFEDVKRCLFSIMDNTDGPFTLILVNDGSDEETTAFLTEFTDQHQNIRYIHNEKARGYTRAANQGLRSSTTDLVILLNSDTVVSRDWVNRMASTMFASEKIGLVGPLSNTASWQSIPDISEGGDWASNPLPEGLSIHDMADLVAKYSGQIYPRVPLLNGFCWMFNRELIKDIGYLDEENFGQGYGEEDDYVLRARKAGWKVIWADDVYVYHAQSRSFSHERRKELSQHSLEKLIRKYDRETIDHDSGVMLQDRVLHGIRERNRIMLEREEYIRKGFERFKNKKVLFILPIAFPGGGGNVVIDEGIVMAEMGVDVRLFNLVENKDQFLNSYPHLKLPVIFGDKDDIPSLARQYDAVIATMHATVKWLEPIQRKNGSPVLGYYVQGFEALIYGRNSWQYKDAVRSYSLIPDMVRFCKTRWVHDQVLKNTGEECHIIGISNNIDLFRPRSPIIPSSENRQIRIGAMVRAATHYRSPILTMKVLRQIAHEFGDRVQPIIFGVDQNTLASMYLPSDFDFWCVGVINQKQMANLLNNLDVFVDFSSHQAMGLTALEAMACGCAVIVPDNGGAVEFVNNGENGLVVDTSSERECYSSLKRLVEQDDLRKKIQRKAAADVCRYHPEGAAYRILDVLFGK